MILTGGLTIPCQCGLHPGFLLQWRCHQKQSNIMLPRVGRALSIGLLSEVQVLQLPAQQPNLQLGRGF